jgi:hypothetical protein
MQELSVTINNSVLPSVCSWGEESQISASSAHDANDWQRARPNEYDPPSVSGGIAAELLQEPSTLEHPQSRRQASVACSASVLACGEMYQYF